MNGNLFVIISHAEMYPTCESVCKVNPYLTMLGAKNVREAKYDLFGLQINSDFGVQYLDPHCTFLCFCCLLFFALSSLAHFYLNSKPIFFIIKIIAEPLGRAGKGVALIVRVTLIDRVQYFSYLAIVTYYKYDYF